MIKKRFLALLAASSCMACAFEVAAQSPSIIGIDPSTQTQYECLRFPNPKLNVVRTTKGARQRTLKIKAAKSIVTERIRLLKARKASLNSLLRDAVKAEKKLLSSPLITLTPEKLVKAKEKVAALSEKVNQVELQGNVLKELLLDIKDCSKTNSQESGGSVQILSGLYNGGGNFYVIVGYVFDFTRMSAQRYCARVIGNKVTYPGWSQVLTNEPPVQAALIPNVSPCSRLGFSCLDSSRYAMFVFASTTGVQAPGSCSPPIYCSLDQAVADAKKFFEGIIVSDVAPYTDQKNCF